jgi:hypothetical protein
VEILVVLMFLVAEKLLHGTEVGARLQQVRGEGVAAGVTSGRLGEPRLGGLGLDDPLED